MHDENTRTDTVAVRFTNEGELVVRYPGGIEDKTGLFPSLAEREIVERFAVTTSGSSLLMRQWRREIRDPLTELLRRDPGREMIAEQLGRIASKPFTGTVSVLFIDLDHFGQVNKQYSHAVGDAVLKWAADIFRRRTRSSDVLIRWGGEEFVIFTMAGMPPKERDGERDRETSFFSSPSGVTEHDFSKAINNGQIVASRIIHTMKDGPCMVGGVYIVQSATIGVASRLVMSDEPMEMDGLFDSLLKTADELVVKAKNSDERNRVHTSRVDTGRVTQS